MSEKGIFTISIDVEMAWGTFDRLGHIRYRESYENYRLIIDELLKLFNRYNISATWAIVGHLFLESCKKENGMLHPDIIRPRYAWFKGDWLRYDPGTDIKKDKIWYGSDIVDKIKTSTVAQEIGSHSFCHPVFSDSGCSHETAESDIAKCVAVAKEKDIKLDSFVFPRNYPGHLDVLSKYGFKIFRGKDALFCDVRPGVLRKTMVLMADMLETTPPVVWVEQIKENNLIEIKGSMLFRFAHGASQFIPKGVRFKKAKNGINDAIAKKRIFHLWFHPMSFAWKMPQMLAELEDILSYGSKKRDAGEIEILTLKDLGARYAGINAS